MWDEDQSGAADAELIRRCQSGDAAAFEALFARHRRPLLAYLRSRLPDHALAEDLVQDSFLALARNMDRIDPRRGVAAWLFRVARNRAVDVMRKRSFEDLPGTELLTGRLAVQMSPEGTAPEQIGEGERDVALRAALEGLPEAEREVLRLRYFGDLRFREIAAALGRPLSTVLWLSRRGLSRLKRNLAEQDGT